MKAIWFIGLLVSVVLVSGCTSSTTSPQSSQQATPPGQTIPPPPSTATVENIDFSFYPAEVVLAKGGTVTWKQKDYDQHTVTSKDFDSGPLTQGKTFSHTFNEAGTFEYWSKNDPSMRGKIIVK